MPKVTFVIGATASGKTYYINHNFADKNVEIVDAEIEIYVMCPGEERWQENIRLRKLEDARGSFEMNTAEIEFPNPAEGIDSIYEVSDDGVKLRMDPPLEEQFLTDARKQIAEEREHVEKEDLECLDLELAEIVKWRILCSGKYRHPGNCRLLMKRS